MSPAPRMADLCEQIARHVTHVEDAFDDLRRLHEVVAALRQQVGDASGARRHSRAAREAAALGAEGQALRARFEQVLAGDAQGIVDRRAHQELRAQLRKHIADLRAHRDGLSR